MADYNDDIRQERRKINDETPRRRSTDVPQPLDYPTRELVRDIVEGETPARAPQVSFIHKLLGLGRN